MQSQNTPQHPTPQGQCAHCHRPNPYTNPICAFCGARLPWADAIAPPSPSQPATLPIRRAIQPNWMIVVGLVIAVVVIGLGIGVRTTNTEPSAPPNKPISNKGDFPGSPLLSDEENEYVRLVGETIDAITAADHAIQAARKAATTNSDVIQQELGRGRLALAQAKSTYTAFPFPPRFAKTDSLIREALAEEDQAFSYWADGFAANDRETAARATSHYVYASELIHMALMEIKRIAAPTNP